MKDTEEGRRPEDIRDVHDKGPDRGRESPNDGRRPDRPGRLTIRIDRKEYRVPPELLDAGRLTGQQIRRLADPKIGPDRDLFEVVPGGSDRKIGNQDKVLIRNHMRFFSAPAVINPGAEGEGAAGGLQSVGLTNGGSRHAAE